MISLTVVIPIVVFAYIIGIITGRVAAKQACDERIRSMMNAKLHEALDLPLDENLGD